MTPPSLSVRDVVRPTTFVAAPRLARRLDVEITLASETFQYTGSFKFRAAYSVASGVPHRAVVTASSGNFGQALAYACGLLGKRCTVVMPSTSSRVKVAAVREYGGEVVSVDVSKTSRAERVREVARDQPDAYVASAYDDPLVIRGNASLGEEIAARGDLFDGVLVPVGGGGLASGVITGLRSAGCAIPVFGAEPMLANDAAESLRKGVLVRSSQEAPTVADGARTVSLGEHNWAVIREGIAGIVEVPEQAIEEATRLLFSLANLKAEPTGALAVAAVLADPERFRGRRVCCVVSGGNVDPEVYGRILAG